MSFDKLQLETARRVLGFYRRRLKTGSLPATGWAKRSNSAGVPPPFNSPRYRHSAL